MKISKLTLAFVCSAILLAAVAPAFCWSNGGFSANPANPDYGTHDWIAQHALDYLPAQEKQYITDNLAVYLLGTELPDNSNKTIGGIGDTTKHHVYYNSAGTLIDDAAAVRANDTFNQALAYLKSKDYADAAKTAGTMTHYIDDVAVFGHVMGASTDWGTETHHSDYEDHVDGKTGSYQSSFDSYLSYDGSLTTVTAYTATANLAYNTVFGGSSQRNCVWMDTHYNWSDLSFSGRCGESLNLAVNAVADVLHTLYVDSSPSPTSTPASSPTLPPSPTPTINPTPTATPKPSATPTTAPTSAGSPTPKSSTTSTATQQPTAAPTATIKPSTSPYPTPTVPEFPAVALLVVAVLTLAMVAFICKKKHRSSL